MKTTSTELRAHLDGGLLNISTCWKIVRTDGAEFYLTDSDEDIVYDGITYSAQDPYSRTAIANDMTLAADNVEIFGILNSGMISADEMERGMFDWAYVEIFTINYVFPEWGPLKLKAGWFGQVTLLPSGSAYTTELRGLAQKLDASTETKTSPECSTDLGSDLCKIEIDVPEVKRSTAYAVGDLVRGRSIQLGDPTFKKMLTNTDFSGQSRLIGGQFDSIGVGPLPKQHGPDGWDDTPESVSGICDPTLISDSFEIAELRGKYYLQGKFNSYGFFIKNTLIDLGVTEADIDYGHAVLNSSIYNRFRSGADRTFEASATFLDESDNVLGTAFDLPPLDRFEAGIDVSVWTKYTFYGIPIPSGTRQVKFRFHCASPAGINATDVALPVCDAIVLKETPSILDFQGLVYRCTTAGTTAASIGPTDYVPVIGDTTTDGTAIFTAEQSWRIAGFVTEAFDKTAFNMVTYGDARAEQAKWFNNGVIQFQSGKNSNRSIEVKEAPFDDVYYYRANIWLPMPGDIESGDLFWIHPGCDGRRETCRDKFFNILNMRAFPDLPGQDEIEQFHATP